MDSLVWLPTDVRKIYFTISSDISQYFVWDVMVSTHYRTNTELLSNLWKWYLKIETSIIFIQENAFENVSCKMSVALHWRHNGPNGVSNHQPHHCWLNRSFMHRPKNTSNSASLAFVQGIHRSPVNSPRKWPVTQKMFPFDDVIMKCRDSLSNRWNVAKCLTHIFLL